jgi:DUSAM domain-containing protein
MTYQSKPPPGDWDRLRELEDKVKAGETISRDASTDELLERASAQVGLDPSHVKSSLKDDVARKQLVLEMRRRIREGSRRLSAALVRANALQQEGKPEEAKEGLQRLADEAEVPFYREIAESEIIRVEEESGDTD